MQKTVSESLLAALSIYCEQHSHKDAADKPDIAKAFYQRYADLLSHILTSDTICDKVSSEITGKVSTAQKELLESLLSHVKSKSKNPQATNAQLLKAWAKNLEKIINSLTPTSTSRHGAFVRASTTSAAAAAAATSHPDKNIEAGTHRKKP